MGQQNKISDDDGRSKPLGKKRSRTLVVSVITGIAIVLFCVFTIARTRFETYPTSPSLASVASPPKGLSEQPYDLGELDTVDEEEPDAPEEKDSVALKVIFVEDEASHPLASLSSAGSHPTQMTPLQPSAAVQDTFVKRIQAQQQELRARKRTNTPPPDSSGRERAGESTTPTRKRKDTRTRSGRSSCFPTRDDPTKSKIGTRACRRTTAPQPNSKLPQ